MRSSSGSTAPLLPLSVLVIGCTWVDPSECWVNTSGGFGGGGTIPIGNAVGASSGDFATPPRSGPLDYGGKSNPCMTPDSPRRKSGDARTPESPGSVDPLAGIDPQVLAQASLRTSAFVYYMDGMLESSTADLSDPTALAAAFEQDAPTPEREVNAWLGTLDASTLSTVVNYPRLECTEKHGCPFTGYCINEGSWPIESTICYVNDCGDAKCRLCPDWFPPFLKHLVFASWCSYVCTASNWKVPAPVVAQGAVMIKTNGEPFPKKGLVWCLDLKR